MKVNLHTHTTYCDGKNPPEEMILSAISAGFDVLGFSGHSYTSFDESYCMSREETKDYIKEIRTLADRYRDRISVFCGIEKDFFADDPAPLRRNGANDGFDYAIGSVHAVFKPFDMKKLEADGLLPPPEGIIPAADGCYVYVDWTAEAMEWAIAHLYGGGGLALAEDYFDHTAQIAAWPDVQIAGHFDLLTKFDEGRATEGKESLFDTEDSRYAAAASRAIAALADAGKIFEINTGAMSKGYRTAPYPSLPLLCEIRKAGGRIMINSDCHAAGKLDTGFDLAMELARKAGFTHRTVLTPAGIWEEVPLC